MTTVITVYFRGLLWLTVLLLLTPPLLLRMTREDDMKAAAKAAAREAETPMEKLQSLLLARGYSGIMRFGRWVLANSLICTFVQNYPKQFFNYTNKEETLIFSSINVGNE